MEMTLRVEDMWVMESVPRKGFMAAIIRRWRAESGMTLTDASSALGTIDSRMNAWEAGRNVPNTADRRRLAELYGKGLAGEAELHAAANRDFLVERDLHGVRPEPTQEWGYSIGPRSDELRLLLMRIAERDLTDEQLRHVAEFVDGIGHLDVPQTEEKPKRKRDAG